MCKAGHVQVHAVGGSLGWKEGRAFLKGLVGGRVKGEMEKVNGIGKELLLAKGRFAVNCGR